MAPRIGFYHLQRWPLETALPKLLEKVLAAGHRAVVMAGSAERVAFLDSLLWTYRSESWLPHGADHDVNTPRQPVFLTCQDENPNGADVLVLTDGVVSSHVESFERCLTLFDGNDPTALEAARNLWRQWKEEGWQLTYYQQAEGGGWQEKARSGD